MRIGDVGFRRFWITLLAVREADRWLLASIHLGLLQAPSPAAADR
jgi:hypothetical protein